ncbi:MAG: hypothetical protein NXI04_05955 [Planctomycetaceae bacterium]|nr:hypothetical protein [Planctomycetaceae bacterium]
MQKAALFLLFGFTVSLWPAECRAQDEEAPATAEADSEEASIDQLERLIYIPFAQLRKVLDNQEASAVVPYAEYMKLLDAYMKNTGAADNSPDAVITESHYSGSVEDDVARIEAELQIEVLREDGWARLPLTFGQSAVGRLKTDRPDDTLLRGVSDGKYELLLKGKGQHTVTISLLAAIKTSPEHRSFRITCPAVGISDLTLTIPEADQAVRLFPLQVLQPVDDAADGTTKIKASLGSASYFEARWNPEAGSQPIMDLLTSVSNSTNVRIEQGLIQTTTQLNYEVLRGELTEVAVAVPADASIIDVVSTSGRIRTWSAEAVGTTHQLLKIELLTAVTESLGIEIQTERTPDGDTVQLIGKTEDGLLRGIHAEGVVRESGRLTLSTDSSLTTVVESQSGVKRIEAAISKGGNPAAQAWEFSGTTGALVVRVKPVEPRLLVAQSSRVIFGNDELKLTSRLIYTVERAGVFQLSLSYPETLTIDTVRADGMSEFNVDKNSGKLTLSLTQKRLGQIVVDVVARQPFDAAAEGLETVVPTITPEGVERESGTLDLYAPRFLDVTTLNDSVVNLFPNEEAGGAAVGSAVRVSSWKYTQRPVAVSVRTSPRPAQLAGSVGTTVEVEPDVAKVSSVATFTVQNAGIDTYRIAVPEAIADEVRFQSASSAHVIQQRDRGDAVDGWVTWTLVLQNEVTGTVAITADWEVPLDTAQSEQEGLELMLQPVQILSPYDDDAADKRRVTLSQTRGEIRLLRHESLSITSEGDGETLERVDVRELELLPQEGYVGYRYFSQPVTISIDVRRHEIHEVVATVVSRAAFEVVTDQQPLASYRCRLRVTTSERQRLLVYLPVGADLQTPLLNNRRTTFEAAEDAAEIAQWDAYYVNISREGTSDQEFLLAFQFRCPITAASEFPYEGQGSKQILRLPMIGDDSGATVVQEVRTAVWSPESISFVGEPRNWKLSGGLSWTPWNPMVSPVSVRAAAELNDWIGDSSGGGDFAQQGNVTVYQSLGRQATVNIVWWNRPFLVAVICGALVFAGFILRRTSWENRLTLVILGTLAVALWSIKDSSETLQFLSAGSLGLIAVAGIWIVGLLLGPDRTAEIPSPPPSEPGAEAGPQTPPEPAPVAPSPIPDSKPQSNTSADESDRTAISPSPEVSKWMNDLMGGK